MSTKSVERQDDGWRTLQKEKSIIPRLSFFFALTFIYVRSLGCSSSIRLTGSLIHNGVDDRASHLFEIGTLKSPTSGAECLIARPVFIFLACH